MWIARMSYGTCLAVVLASGGCGLFDDAEDFGNLIFGDKGSIPRESLGVQNEFHSSPKGGATAQGDDIRFNLNVTKVRSSFQFDDGFLPSEGASPNFARFDAILGALPEGTELLAILSGAPSWLANRADWKDVFVERFVIPVLDRYGGNGKIGAWEIWNEPDGFCDGRGGGIPPGVLDCTPEDYVDLVTRVAPEIRARSGARIVGAATTAINQSFPDHLNFNRAMVSAGLLSHIDVYNFHWYGGQLEKLFAGIRDFLDSTGKEVWCTESGARGSTRQLAHAEDVFPPLFDNIGRMTRLYVFTYFDGEGPSTTFGLVANDGTESDLYQFLRDNP